MKIKDLNLDDRPREKMLSLGVRALSNSDLLAILIGSGTEKQNASDIAKELLSGAGGRLAVLSAIPMERLMRQDGIGPVRAATICAALELGRRTRDESSTAGLVPVTSPELVYQYIMPTLRGLDHEECWCLYLNRKGYIIGKEQVGSGSMEKTVVDSQRILRRAIEKQASQIILVHNHPGGDPSPSPADVAQTDALRKALCAVEITLTDHVIVSDSNFFSFSEDRFFGLK